MTNVDEFPKGFYLRRMQGVLWLCGYVNDDLYVYDPEDRLAFCTALGFPAATHGYPRFSFWLCELQFESCGYAVELSWWGGLQRDWLSVNGRVIAP